MSVEESTIIDAIGSDLDGREVTLLITDHLSWDNESEHLLKLQDKINAYVRFVESGELYEKHKEYLEMNAVIEIAFQHRINEKGIWFIDQVKSALSPIGIGIRYTIG